MAEEKGAETAEAPAKSKGRMTPLIIVATLMIGEGVGVFMLVKALSPAPVPVMAMEGAALMDGAGEAENKDLVEVDLAECRPSNRMSGKLVTFHIRVSGLVEPGKQEEVQEMIRGKQARIDDAVNIVVRAAEPVELNEPGLETVRRRIRHELGRVFGDDELIRQVLIPQMLQSGPGL